MSEQNIMLTTAYKALDDKFGKDICIMDISEVSGFTDYFMIAEGSNPNQISAMADNVAFELKKVGIEVRSTEGYNSGWVLLDFGDLIVHIFDSASRQFYNLERVWGDAKIIKLEQNTSERT